MKNRKEYNKNFIKIQNQYWYECLIAVFSVEGFTNIVITLRSIKLKEDKTDMDTQILDFWIGNFSSEEDF